MARSLWSYGKVQRLVSRLVRSRPVQARFVPESTLLNVGCGANMRPEFLNLDYEWRPGINLCWDITRPIPRADESLTGIYSEHCLEHVSYDDAAAALRDFYRMLRPDGVLRILVPDGGMYLDLYHRARAGETVSFPYVDDSGIRDLAEDSRFGFTPMMAVNRIFRGYEHLFAYDADTLANLMRQAGFRDIQQTSFRVGRFPPLLIDSEMRAPQTLFMEATK